MNKVAIRFGIDLGNKLFQIDTGYVRPSFDACYLVAQRAPSADQLAIIDTGTNFSVPRILAAIKDIGCEFEQVRFIILTHIHLDHAGGAGLLMQYCPNAKLVVHPRGVRHMVDPSNLLASAIKVYGTTQVERDYGRLIPIPSKRIIEAHEGTLINLAGRILTLMDTPGHAKHHICIWDEMSRGMFTGDTFGLSYRELDTEKGSFIIPTTTPVQFEPKSLRASLKKIMAFNPNYFYLTHFGKVGQTQVLYEQFLMLLNDVENLGKQLKGAKNRHNLIKEGLFNLYFQHLQEHGYEGSEAKAYELLHFDVELNAQGMGIWLDAS